MKKQLLLGSALLAAVTSYSQNARVKPNGVINAMDRVALKFQMSPNESGTTTMSERQAPAQNEQVNAPESQASSLAAPSGTWTGLSTSRNIFGMLVSHSKPLNYNHNVNAVSFVHRTGVYTTTPVDNSGSIIAKVSTNWGTSWDTTALWANSSQLARYPQGGIYSAPGNTDINNAYIVGTGPVTGGSGWLGNWYASKKLGTGMYTNAPDNTPNAQQFVSNSAPTGSLLAHDMSRYSFTSTDDGLVRSIGILTNDVNAQGNLPGDSALYLVTGSFNAGTFNWSGTTIQPPYVKASDGTYQMIGYAWMAWNQAGTVGYVMSIGARNGVTVTENKGFQPIVYKTTNSGASWSLLTGIDFTAGTFTNVTYPLAPIGSNSNVAIPFFNFQEGIDMVVDANDKLHIVSTVIGTSSDHPDTLGYIYSFTNFDGESYRWPHAPSAQPYIYDFITDGSSWSYRLIDSLSSEVPSASASGNGYNANPWDPDPSQNNGKVSSSSRLQVGRTPSGSHLVYSWAESDTNFTNNSIKWNTIPDVKARVLNVATSSLTPEVNVSKIGGTPNVNGVTARSMFHYMSPVVGTFSVGQVTVPFTVSNSNPYSQLTMNKHWYISAKLDADGTVGVNETSATEASMASSIYPNPAQNDAILVVSLNENTAVNVTVYNAIGQAVSTIKTEGNVGRNEINLNLNNLSAGIYMVNVKAGNATTTKKLIVE